MKRWEAEEISPGFGTRGHQCAGFSALCLQGLGYTGVQASITSNDSAILIERHVGLFVKKSKRKKKGFRFKEYSISVRPLKVQNISQQDAFVQLLITLLFFYYGKNLAAPLVDILLDGKKESLSFQASKVLFSLKWRGNGSKKAGFAMWKIQTDYVGLVMSLFSYKVE